MELAAQPALDCADLRTADPVVFGALTSHHPAGKVLLLAELPRLGGAMDVPADRSRSTSAPPIHPSLREAVRSPRRRRPTGAAPPLPYRLQTSGVGWLVAAVVLVGLTLAIFGRGLRGPAVTATVIDDAVVAWLAGLVGPGLVPLLRAWRASAPGGCCTRCTTGWCWRCWS
jgi:hypothetical protein